MRNSSNLLSTTNPYLSFLHIFIQKSVPILHIEQPNIRNLDWLSSYSLQKILKHSERFLKGPMLWLDYRKSGVIHVQAKKLANDYGEKYHRVIAHLNIRRIGRFFAKYVVTTPLNCRDTSDKSSRSLPPAKPKISRRVSLGILIDVKFYSYFLKQLEIET